MRGAIATENVEEWWDSPSHWDSWAPKYTYPLGYSMSPFLCTYNVLGMIAYDLDSAASGTVKLSASLHPQPLLRLLELDREGQQASWAQLALARTQVLTMASPTSPPLPPAVQTGIGGVKT